MQKIIAKSDDFSLFIATIFIPVLALLFFVVAIFRHPNNNAFLIHIFIVILIIFLLVQTFFCSVTLFEKDFYIRRWQLIKQKKAYKDIKSFHTLSVFPGMIIIVLDDGFFLNRVVITFSFWKKTRFMLCKEIEMLEILKSKTKTPKN